MPNDYLISEDTDTLVFCRPPDIRTVGISISILFGLFVVWPYLDYFSHPPLIKEGVWFGYMIPSFIFGPWLWLGLCFASPLHLRFNLRQGTYEIRDGCFPLRRTERGTIGDIEHIYVFGYFVRSAGLRVYPVLLQWKRRGLWRRRPIRLALTDNKWDAEQEAWAFARKIGVPCGNTVIQGQRSA